VNLVEVIRQVSERFRASFKEENLDFQDNMGDDQTITVMADPERLAQLFNNVLKNALDYVEAEGKIMIWLEKHGDHVALHIEDSGPGVPPEALPRLFERLYRVDRSRNRKSGGSGLGLAICRNIVEAHGGTISASTSRLGGLSINIELPLNRT
jgi:two-component system sensor histidine kinase BaeS